MKNIKLQNGLMPVCATLSLCSCTTAQQAPTDKPNVLIIQTDEHSFKTLGCYRELMAQAQAFPWGDGIEVTTPNIDRLAHEGAICTNYYASSPVSTPSRASFQTGLYPVVAGAPINGMTMDPSCRTFAQVLRDEGYQTNYIGKWHLAGVPYLGSLYMAPGYDFGYMDRKYQFEGGHSKWYTELENPYGIKASYAVPKVQNPDMYSTDYLTNRCLELLERDKDKSFCLMLSIPDPHSPDISREPYTTQYKELDAQAPTTMATYGSPQRAGWAVGGKNESGEFSQHSVREYFGMVKCIDDNVGRILDYLDDNGLTENTIVVFTSDHGDMLFEHHRINKDLPLESSAKIPFVVRYPKKIKAGKVIESAYTNVDFAPTLLGLLGYPQIEGVHGINDAEALTSDNLKVTSERIVYMTDSPFNEWTAATDGRYKLVLSCRDTPWLIDRVADPDELKNFYSDPAYKEIAEKLQTELVRQMQLYKDPAIALKRPFLYSSDQEVTFKNVYEGLNDKQIKECENDILNNAIRDIHQNCYNRGRADV
ncbi:MAG: sulfatase-like hydrolase/transferase [Rikenellaceae bacterium]